MPPAGFRKRIKDPHDPNAPELWVKLGDILDDNNVAFNTFDESSRVRLEEMEALSWAAVPSQSPVIRDQIGAWAGHFSYACSCLARAKVYEARAKAVVKFTLKRSFPAFATQDQVDASAARVVGYRQRWEAVRDGLEEKIRVGKKLLGDEDRERKAPQQ